MKKLVLVTILIFTLISCGKTVKKDDNKLKNNSILYSLPENTQLIMNLKSINSVFENFKITDSKIFGNDLLTKDKYAHLINKLSINPFNLKDLTKIGIDTNKQLGFSLNDALIKEDGDDFSSVNFVLYLPLKDSKKTLAFIDGLFLDGKLKSDKDLNVNYKKENGYIKVFGKKKEEAIYIFVKDGYLFAIINPFSPESSLDLAKNMMQGKTSIKNSKLFRENIEFSKLNKGLYLYANAENFIQSNKKAIIESLKEDNEVRFESIDGFQTVTSLLELDSKDFNWNLSAVMDKDSKIMKDYMKSIAKNIKCKKDNNSTLLSIDKPMLAVMSIFIENSNEIFKNIIKAMTGYKITKATLDEDNEHFDKLFNEKLEVMNKEFGIDIKKSLIDNFDGNIKYASYDGMGIGMTSYNTAFSIGFRDLKTLELTFDKLLTHKYLTVVKKHINKTTYKGNTVYIFTKIPIQIYIGFNKKEIIIASSKSLYDKAISVKKGNGFYEYSKADFTLNKVIKSDFFFYVSFLELIKAINNFKMLVPKRNIEELENAIDLMELVNYLSINSDMKNNTLKMSYIFNMNTKTPFFITLIDSINKLNKK